MKATGAAPGAWDPVTRVLACGHCGAPILAGPSGGRVTCGSCSVTSEVGVRDAGPIYFPNPMLDPSLGPEEIEAARLDLIRRQASFRRDSPDPYDLSNVPPECAALGDLALGDESATRLLSEAFAIEYWRRVSSPGYMSCERPIWWIAARLSEAWSIRGESMRSRAVLQTALELVFDPGLRYILTCRLAVSATRDGSLDDAASWLEACDPRPHIASLDAAFREARRALERAGGRVHAQEARGGPAGRPAGADSVKARILICRRCGGPLDAPGAGGLARCGYCGASDLVKARRTEPLLIPHEDRNQDLSLERWERRRRRILSEQARNYDENHPYNFDRTPPEYAYVGELTYADPLLPPLNLQAFLNSVRLHRASGGAAVHEREVMVLTRKIYFMMLLYSDVGRARSVIETALDVVSDPGYEQELYCLMANLARRSGDLQAAESWLDLCDQQPPHIALDGELRCRRARVRIDQCRYKEALDLVGRKWMEIPFGRRHEFASTAVRVMAYERTGRPDEAGRELHALVSEGHQVNRDYVYSVISNDAEWATVLEVFERLRKRGLIEFEEDKQKRRAAARRSMWLIAAAGAALAAVAAGLAVWSRLR